MADQLPVRFQGQHRNYRFRRQHDSKIRLPFTNTVGTLAGTWHVDEAVENEKHVHDLMKYRDRPERTVDEVLERIAFYRQAAKE